MAAHIEKETAEALGWEIELAECDRLAGRSYNTRHGDVIFTRKTHTVWRIFKRPKSYYAPATHQDSHCTPMWQRRAKVDGVYLPYETAEYFPDTNEGLLQALSLPEK